MTPTQEGMIRFIMERANSNSSPDAMGAALNRIEEIIDGRMQPYTVCLMDVDDSDWSPWLALGTGRDDAIAHAKEQWERDGEISEENGSDVLTLEQFKKQVVLKVYHGWIGSLVGDVGTD